MPFEKKISSTIVWFPKMFSDFCPLCVKTSRPKFKQFGHCSPAEISYNQIFEQFQTATDVNHFSNNMTSIYFSIRITKNIFRYICISNNNRYQCYGFYTVT